MSANYTDLNELRSQKKLLKNERKINAFFGETRFGTFKYFRVGIFSEIGTNYFSAAFIRVSFGNFIFDQSWSYETSHSQIAELKLSKNKVESLKLYPIEIKFNTQPWLMP